MESTIFRWLLDIPQAVGNFAGWLTTDLSIGSWSISPLGLLGIGGTAILIGIIGVHIVRLFV